MAGFTQQLSRSLRWRLAVGLSLLVSAVALVAGFVTYHTAIHEAHGLQDAQLKHIAGLIDPRTPILRQEIDPNQEITEENGLPQPDVVIQNLNSPRLDRIFSTTNTATRMSHYHPGFHDFRSDNGEEWRVYIHTFRRPGHRIVIAQRVARRNLIAGNNARLAVLPLLVLIPLVWLFAGLFIHRMLKPLQRLSSEVNLRTENDLQALDSRRVPLEVLPLVEAINRQFQQISAAREHDKRFIGNAAHELRTPITALTLQMAQLTQQNLSEHERQQQLAKVRTGLQRTQQLLNQLLNMARAQNTPKSPATAQIRLLPLLRTLYTDLLPIIEQKELDVGVLLKQDYQLSINHADAHSIFKNLLENAVRYTPAGGRIDIWCEEGNNDKLYIWVADTGVGIPAAEREHIFEPFYRVSHNENGSGLGLAIVQTLCEKWSLGIQLADSPLENGSNPPGLAIAITLSAPQWQTVPTTTPPSTQMPV